MLEGSGGKKEGKDMKETRMMEGSREICTVFKNRIGDERERRRKK